MWVLLQKCRCGVVQETPCDAIIKNTFVERSAATKVVVCLGHELCDASRMSRNTAPRRTSSSFAMYHRTDRVAASNDILIQAGCQQRITTAIYAVVVMMNLR